MNGSLDALLTVLLRGRAGVLRFLSTIAGEGTGDGPFIGRFWAERVHGFRKPSRSSSSGWLKESLGRLLGELAPSGANVLSFNNKFAGIVGSEGNNDLGDWLSTEAPATPGYEVGGGPA